ncbi:MAG: nicotianamine synthase family protein [Pseudomonadota bacterium]
MAKTVPAIKEGEALTKDAATLLTLCFDIVTHDLADGAKQEHLFAEIDEILERLPAKDIDALLRSSSFGSIRNRVHEIRAAYEYQRELELSREIIARENAAVANAFRSHDWYDKALDFETKALSEYAPKRLLFVGSGPFPTSPMAFQRNDPAAKVTCMDRSGEACALAREVSAIFGMPDLDIVHADGAAKTDFSTYDCVIVGLVVGATERDKAEIVNHFLHYVPTSSLLCFRSATGSGRVIYPSVNLQALDGYDIDVLESPPHKSFTLVIVKR